MILIGQGNGVHGATALVQEGRNESIYSNFPVIGLICGGRTDAGRGCGGSGQDVDRADRHHVYQSHQNDDRSGGLLFSHRGHDIHGGYEEAGAHRSEDTRHLHGDDSDRDRDRLCCRYGDRAGHRHGSADGRSTEGEGSAVDHAGLCCNDPVESDRFHGEGGHPSDHYLCALHRGRYHFRRRKACGDPDLLLRCDG
ncbi:Uncharacterised protein [Bacteroides xylanisolvens]|nr:Uncharacterised protein [Bacteroides xylanisolvens]